jgi:hypothetical protein
MAAPGSTKPGARISGSGDETSATHGEIASAPSLEAPSTGAKVPAATLFAPPLVAKSVKRGAFFTSDDAESVAAGTQSASDGAFFTGLQSRKWRA